MDRHQSHAAASSIHSDDGMSREWIDDDIKQDEEKDENTIPILCSSDNNPSTPRQPHQCGDDEAPHHPVTIPSTIPTKGSPRDDRTDDDSCDDEMIIMSNNNDADPRPMLNLLTMEGLLLLCKNEFTIRQLTKMEMDVLFGLEWKVVGVSTPLDWLDVFLSFGRSMGWDSYYSHYHARGHDHGPRNFVFSSRQTHYWNEAHELSLVQLEDALRNSHFMMVSPMVTALAAFLNSIEEVILDSLRSDHHHHHYQIRIRVGCDDHDDSICGAEDADDDFFPKVVVCESNDGSCHDGVMHGSHCNVSSSSYGDGGGFPTAPEYLQRMRQWMDLDFDRDELRVVRDILKNSLHSDEFFLFTSSNR
ncbi:hypothetical protein ACHAXS_000648 [Conticribra weissflogii]